MRKTMILLLAAATPVCLQAQRMFEPTNDSWLWPDHSVETYAELVVTGLTDYEPNSGFHLPAFKITDVNGNPGNFFYTDFGLGMDIHLMDFTIREDNGTIFLAAFTQKFPYTLIVAEVDFNGNPNQVAMYRPDTDFGTIPHQIIYSEDQQQVVIVGAHLHDELDGSNGASAGKTAFVIGTDANNLSSWIFHNEVDTPAGGFTDNDIYENVTQFPDGYFIAGSANDPASSRQLMTILGIDFGGGQIHSAIWDNSNSRYTSASVMYSEHQGAVYLLANNSVVHQFEIEMYDPWSGAPLTGTMHRYMTNGLPIGSGVDQNGFRLRETNDGLILVGGYFTDWNRTTLPTLITPFQMTLDPGLGSGAFISHRLYQSDNDADLVLDYMTEIGNSVYINTPDILAYSRDHDLTFLVNPNTNYGGFDNHYSHPLEFRECERELDVTWFDNPPVFVSDVSAPLMALNAENLDEWPVEREIHEEPLCWPFQKTAIADSRSDVRLFPNPASDQLTIALHDEEIRSVAIYDLSGALLLRCDKEAAFETTIDVGRLASGAYRIDITDARGIVRHDTFLKD